MKFELKFTSFLQWNQVLQRKEPITFFHQEVERLAKNYRNSLKIRTPVGVYQTLRVGGVLQAGWEPPSITYLSSQIIVRIPNPVFYASFVNYGHRTPGGGFLLGRHMIRMTQEAFLHYDFPQWKKRVEQYIATWSP